MFPAMPGMEGKTQTLFGACLPKKPTKSVAPFSLKEQAHTEKLRSFNAATKDLVNETHTSHLSGENHHDTAKHVTAPRTFCKTKCTSVSCTHCFAVQ
jgi:hypothetical protein